MPFIHIFSRLCVLSAAMATLAACGTTYQLAEVGQADVTAARGIFVEAQSEAQRKPASEQVATARFQRVTARVKPVAESLCRQEMALIEGFDCNVDIQIDREMSVRNAYFTYDKSSHDPIIAVTMPMLRDVRNDDELAFVLGHEYGHLIGQHIEKQTQQMVAGMLIMGMIGAMAAANNPYTDPNLINDSVSLGGAIGQAAFSQTYELESDTLGTAIARQAGYDPVLGARYFARPEGKKTASGTLSFWGTHPPDETRIATVLATSRLLESENTLRRRQ